jgi:hypothetical protein
LLKDLVKEVIATNTFQLKSIIITAKKTEKIDAVNLGIHGK